MARRTAMRAGDVSPLLRLVVSVLIGAGAAVGIAQFSVAGSALGGWAVGAAIFVAWTWLILWPMDNVETATHASREEPTQAGTFALIIIAAMISLAGVALVLSHRNRTDLVALALLAVVASWAAIHSMFATHYARIYFAGGGGDGGDDTSDGGGIDFHQDTPPRYSDFVYVAITVGMSYAISDTDLGSSRLRRVGVCHALLSYLFGTVIVAQMVNLVLGT